MPSTSSTPRASYEHGEASTGHRTKDNHDAGKRGSGLLNSAQLAEKLAPSRELTEATCLRTPEANVTHAHTSGMPGPALRAMSVRVLLLERDVTSRTALHAMLAGPGIEVVEASDGHEACAAAAQSDPHVVVLDWCFGEGLTLVRKLAAHGIANRIVLLSSITDPRDQRAALEAGVARYLAKPTHRAQLVGAIHEVALAHVSGH